MTISTVAEKSSDKIQHSFMILTFHVGLEGGTVVGSVCCSYTETKFGTLNLHGNSQTFVAPTLDNPKPLSVL